MSEFLDLTVAEMATAVRDRRVKSIELVDGFLERIERVNPQLNAVVYPTAELARKYAAKYDAELEQGNLRGALHGVPMTIKDSLDTADAVTTWGTLGRKDYRPGTDATCVARLKAAGAIMLGKTNTPEFTLWFQTDNSVYGRTNNPFDLERTPGGSSGGATAIIAAGASPFDIGTDTGGSIRLPAHFSGIAGIKPTAGRVPCTGNSLPSAGIIAGLSQPGPLARHVDDLELLLGIIKGPDFIDPNCFDVPLHASKDVDLKTLKIGWHVDNGVKTPTQDVQNAITGACQMLIEEGFDLSEAKPSGIEMTNFIMTRVFGADGGELVETLLDESRTDKPSPRIAASLRHRGGELSQREFARTINLWDNYRSSMLGFFRDFDVLICPVNAHPAIRHGEEEDMAAYSYTTSFNLTGWPGAVIRAGTSAEGLPIGLQIVAAPWREDHCLAVARWLEARLGPFPGPGVTALNR